MRAMHSLCRLEILNYADNINFYSLIVLLMLKFEMYMLSYEHSYLDTLVCPFSIVNIDMNY